MAEKELGTCLGHITGKLYENGETVETGPSKATACIILSRIITSLLRTGVSENTIDLAVAAGKDDFFNADDEDNGNDDIRDDEQGGPDPSSKGDSEDSENVPAMPSAGMA